MSKEIKLKDQRSNEEIGKRLRKLRKERSNFTCQGLAVEFNCADSLVQKIETGKNALSREMAIKYYDYFGISLDYIFFGTEPDKISDFLGIFQELSEAEKKEIVKEMISFL